MIDLEARRAELKLSRQQVATAMGLPVSQIWKAEKEGTGKGYDAYVAWLAKYEPVSTDAPVSVDGGDRRERRESAGISRGDLASTAGLTISAVSRIEQGRGNPLENEAYDDALRGMQSSAMRPFTEDGQLKGAFVGWDTPARKNGVKACRPEHWVVTCPWENINAGDIIRINGEEGAFMFIEHVDTGKSVWITCVGGPNGESKFRSFAPERIIRG